MAKTIQTLIDEGRAGNLLEGTASFWTDAELLVHAVDGIKDLWGHIKDTYQDYFFTVVENVTMGIDATTLSNVPADIAEVRRLEVADLANRPGIVFTPKAYNHDDFAGARAKSAQDPSYGLGVFYALTCARGP